MVDHIEKVKALASIRQTRMAVAKIQIECIGSSEMEKGLRYALCSLTLFLKKKSSRKHWYQSHSHTHNNNRDMGCGVSVGAEISTLMH
jgi:hypothetical protein